VQFQSETSEALTQYRAHPLYIFRIFEGHHEIITVPDQRRSTGQAGLGLMNKPFIEHVVQVKIG